ncbi:MAG: AMP-binding protein [Burkholderiales bacterium]|nr:AMP-binding protein [Burkholderiales bacterium]
MNEPHLPQAPCRRTPGTAASIVMGERKIDLAAFEERVSRAVSGFEALGVREDDAVLLLLRNDIAFLEASAALSRLGAYPVPANWHGRADEVEFLIRDSGARTAVVHADLAPLVAGADRLRLLWVRTPSEVAAAYDLADAQCGVPPGGTDWESWLCAHAPASAPARPSRGAIVYTSGTTGIPKGVQRNPYPDAERERLMSVMMRGAFGLTQGCRTIVCGPLYHAMPNVHARNALAALGPDGVIVIEPRFDARRLLELIEGHRIQQLILPPVMFIRLLRLPEPARRRHDLSSLRYVIHSAAPCPLDIKRKMIEWWGPIIHEFYGTTETGLITLANAEEFLRKPGTLGRPVPQAKLKVIDEHGREAPVATPGEICAINRLYPDFTYRNLPGERRKLDRAGLVATGDIGYVDEDGYLFLCDRKTDMVISGGVNIYPAEIEAHLHAMPGLRDNAVFGIPDEEYGEALAAYVETMPGAQVDENEIRAYLAQRLARFMLPKVIRFVAALPRADNGKIYKRRLAEPYWQGLDRRI